MKPSSMSIPSDSSRFSRLNRLVIFSLPPVLISCAILFICYPGFMSYDSLRMLQEAREGVIGKPYPVLPVYILRLFDLGGHGTTLMLIWQNLVVLGALMLTLRLLRVGFIWSSIALAATVAMPTVLGCFLVLWKDVTFTAMALLALGIIFYAHTETPTGRRRAALKWSAIILLCLAALVRFNAVTATCVITVYWISVFYSRLSWTKKGIVLVSIMSVTLLANSVISTWRLPDLKRLAPNNLAYMIMATDLIGISGWSRESLIPIAEQGKPLRPKLPIEDIDAIYDAQGVLAIADNMKLRQMDPAVHPLHSNFSDIRSAWLDAIMRHPFAYIQYRTDLFQEIVGAKRHETFEPTHFNLIDANPYGLKKMPSIFTDLTLRYIKSGSNKVWGKPWFFYLLASISILLIALDKTMQQNRKVFAFYAFSAAALYIIPFYFVSGTGEVRYNFPSLLFCSPCLFVWMSGALDRVRALTGRSSRAVHPDANSSQQISSTTHRVPT